MKKLTHTALISIALLAGTFSANATAGVNTPYACKLMMDRGSSMFCGNKEKSDLIAKAANNPTKELAAIAQKKVATN